MPKNFYFLARRISLVFILASVYQIASAQGFVWVKSYGGTRKDKGKDLGVDQYGNQYISGYFSGQMTLGSTTLSTVGDTADEDIFVTKFDVQGNPVWAHSMGNGINQFDDYSFSTSVNENGWSATTGKCFKYLLLDSGDSIPAFSHDDMFLVTYDPDGNLNWAKVGGGPNDDLGSATFVDNNQNIYCVGNYTGTINFYGDTTINGTNKPHIFCAKYDWSGNLLWIKVFTSQHALEVYDIKVDAGGNIYMSGNFKQSVDFGTFSLLSYGDGDGYVLKMDQQGNILWATSFGSSTATSFESGSTMALDDAGNCYVASTFAYDCNYIGGYLQTNDVKNIMVAAYDVNGNYLWAKAFRGGPQVKFSPVALSLSAEENILLSGIFAGIDTIGSTVLQPYGDPDSADAFIASFSPANGSVNWAIHMGGTSHDGGFGIAGNGTAFGYATGNYRYAAQFGSVNLVSNGGSDFWVAKFEKNTITGNASLPGNQVFQAFPNPFNNELIVGLPCNTNELIIYNAIGQVVLQRSVEKTERQLSLDFSAPAAGTYLIQLKGDYGMTTGKIEKQSY